MKKVFIYYSIYLFFNSLLSCNLNLNYPNNGDIKNNFKLSKIVDSKIKYESSSEIDYLPFTIDNDTVYIYLPTNKKNLILVKTMSLISNYSKIIAFNIPTISEDSKELIINSTLTNLSVSKNYIVFLFHTKLLIFNKNYDFIKYKDLKEPFTSLKVINDKIFVGRCYNHHPKDVKEKFFIEIYDIKSDNIINHLIPKFDFIELSHFFPNSWIDFSDKGDIAVSSTLTYSISFYDSNLSIVNSITRKPKNWIINDKLIEIINKDRNKGFRVPPKDLIADMSDEVNSNGSRIRQIKFINDSTILIAYTAPDREGKEKFINFYDIWKKIEIVGKFYTQI